MFDKTCEICGKHFKVYKRRLKTAHYCSRSCYLIHHSNPPVEKECEVCGKNFTVRAYRKSKARFCSFECGGKWHMQNRKMPNDHKIGNQFRKGQCPTNAFISEQVMGKNNPRWQEGILFMCENCNKDFRVKPWIVRQNGNSRFCSRDCRYMFMCGENSPLWKGGPITYRGRGWLEKRKIAIERDKGTCQGCGRNLGISIPVHHIKPFRLFDSHEEANQLSNLICLCQSCHMKKERVADP